MTWYYDIAADNSSMDVYDHTGALVASVPNDGSGFELPGDVLDVMHGEAVDAFQAAGGTVDQYVLYVLADAAFEQIEAGTP